MVTAKNKARGVQLMAHLSQKLKEWQEQSYKVTGNCQPKGGTLIDSYNWSQTDQNTLYLYLIKPTQAAMWHAASPAGLTHDSPSRCSHSRQSLQAQSPD